MLCRQHRTRARCLLTASDVTTTFIVSPRVFDGILRLRAAFSSAMRLPCHAFLLALSACGLYDDSMPADESFHGAGSGGESSSPPPSIECAPKLLRSQTGELVPVSPLFPQTSRGVEANGCDPAFPGDAQYSWTAPAAGCYTISTMFPQGDGHPAMNTLKVTRDTCDGAALLCSADNYGYEGALGPGPLAQGERLIIAFTKAKADTAAGYHSLRIGLSPCGPR